MDNEMLKENIESLEKVIDNLGNYMFDQEGLIEKMKRGISDAEEEMHYLEEIRDAYKKLLKEKTDKAETDANEPNKQQNKNTK